MHHALLQFHGTGDVFHAPGLKVTVKARAEQSEGASSVLEYELAPGLKGPVPHYHKHTDESFFILEGEVDVLIDDEVQTLRKHDFALIPRGTVHKFSNKNKEKKARMLAMFSPGGFEGYFEEYERLWKNKEFNKIEALREKYDNIHV